MRMCDAIAASGWNVTLFARHGSERSDLPLDDFYGVREAVDVRHVVSLPFSPGRAVSSVLGAVWARSSGATCVLGRDLVGCYVAAGLGLPVSYETHEAPERMQGLRRLVFRRLIGSPQFRRLIVITHTLKEAYQSFRQVSSDMILVLPDGAADGTVDSRQPPDSGRLAVGYVGQLYPGKGMEIIAPLAARCPWADFHVVGGRDGDLSRWRDRCCEQANVRFHGFVPHGLTDRYRGSCDVLLAPFQRQITLAGKGNIASYTSPLKLFEYMSAWRAIVCSDLPVLREVMADGENCLLVPPDDVESWHAALIRLRDDPGLRARLGDTARATFLAKYTWHGRARRAVATLETGSSG